MQLLIIDLVALVLHPNPNPNHLQSPPRTQPQPPITYSHALVNTTANVNAHNATLATNPQSNQ